MIAQEERAAIWELDLRGVRLYVPYNFIIIVLSAETEFCFVVHFIISLRKKLVLQLVDLPSLSYFLPSMWLCVLSSARSLLFLGPTGR